MAGKRTSKRKSSLEDFEEVLEEEELEEDLGIETSDTPIYNTYSSSKSATVKLQSRISAKVIVSGDRTKSGKRYVWERSGAIVEVDDIDAPGLLEKSMGDKTCCGSSPENLRIFILVE